MVVAQIPLWIQHSTSSSQSTSSKNNPPLSIAKDSNNTKDDSFPYEAWNNPRRSAIYTLDISHSRIATGGGDGKIRIWNSSALFVSSKLVPSPNHSNTGKKLGRFQKGGGYESSDASDNEHVDLSIAENRLLSTIGAHSGSVLTLRFSTSGEILASAGDDAHVLLFHQSATKCSSTSGNLMMDDQTDNLEHWTRIRICRGHNLDVVGLAWAPDDSHLVSCSLDSDAPICVWKMHDLQMEPKLGGLSSGNRQNYNTMILHPYKVLGMKEHTSTVKGVTFDPAGKYIVSSGDDPALCIFRAFDDWGLEQRIDASSGIFQQDVQSLANLSMFRRISFAPDGTHVCATNAMVRKQNIAAMVGRSGWGVSSKKADVSGAANLIGHKQPVVTSRHCPYMFEKKDQAMEMGDNENVEPDYYTLIALGDKKGFVTVWSTKKSRPIFKLQCSENRSAVTDIAWGLWPSSKSTEAASLIMVVSLLDGFTVALKFSIEDDIGHILSDEKRNRIFRLKYGIDLASIKGNGATRKRLVDDSSGPKLIENITQYEIEDSIEVTDVNQNDTFTNEAKMQAQQPINTILNVRRKNAENGSSNGKKRLQPVLVSTGTNIAPSLGMSSSVMEQRMNGSPGKRKIDSGGSENFGSNETVGAHDAPTKRIDIGASKLNPMQDHITQISVPLHENSGVTLVSTTNRKMYMVQLQLPKPATITFQDNTHHSERIIASCTNSIQNLPGSQVPVSCATVSISRGSAVTWRDHLLGTNCTALDASSSFIALGSYDGTIYLYSAPSSSGWKSGIAFRSHAPIVLNGSIVRLTLKEFEDSDNEVKNVQMLVVTSDGSFGVYSITPKLKLQYKGTILPAMNQMRLSLLHRSTQNHTGTGEIPELARFVFTDTRDLLLVLCHKTKFIPIGGLLHGFIYNRDIQSWLRISDGRFKYSKLFSTIPTSQISKGYLSKIDQVVQTATGEAGSIRRGLASDTSASEMYFVNEDDKLNLQSYSTRAHCEDRIACSIALRSREDFEEWLRLYIRILTAEGDSDHLRLTIDMILGKEGNNEESSSCWWIYSSADILGLDRKEAVKNIIIPEMTKNRALQRLTNEIVTDMTVCS